ncbi:hypothetical protein [Streptococcus iniae]|uniref:hypothetical protein n=2 Tax=Streptococcus iniae TaxID=1346 RepID=UPI001CD3CD21|nr:hypothetical protein [Streptococcus iniae]MCA1358526.1 hypothetical protein [Streptococcus iniae]
MSYFLKEERRMKLHVNKVVKNNKIPKTQKKVSKTDLVQLVLLLIPAIKLARKILNDRKMR